MCGAKCRTDLEQSVENIPAAVKGALDDIDEKFKQHNGISKICGAKCRTDLEQTVGNRGSPSLSWSGMLNNFLIFFPFVSVINFFS